MQTAIYVRISQDRTGEGLGVGRQEEDCRHLAETLGWTVHDVYPDNDTSASGTKPRIQYRRMLDDIRSGRVGAVIAWHPDRLYRQLSDLEELVELCEAHRIAIRTVQAGDVDLTTPSGRMTARILGATARYEVEHKAERWKRSWRQKREAGVAPSGQRLYGYTDKGQQVEDEAAVLRELAAEVLAGTSLSSLATRLNAAGITTSVGGTWRPNRIRKLLLNPRMAGHATLKGEIIGEGNWEPILPDETWQSVRALLTVRNHSQAPRVALLAGIVVCGVCGEPLNSGRRSDGARRLRCLAGPGLDGCGRIHVVAEPVERIAEDVARGYLSRDPVRRVLAKTRAGGQGHVLAELDAQHRRLEEITTGIADRTVSVAVGGQAEAIVRKRIGELEARLADLTPVPIPADVDVDWPTDLGARRRLVELVVARVWVDPAKVRGGRFDPSRVRIDPTDAVRFTD